jgi:hypothetical protein
MKDLIHIEGKEKMYLFEQESFLVFGVFVII